jgi:protein-S-isoprenylcysteine O-methyltransferase Ste14
MIAAALVIYALFAWLALVWRGWRQYRRTGDHGFRGLSGRLGSMEWFGGVLVALGALTAAAAIVAGLTDGDSSFRLILPQPVRFSGLALMLVGLWLTLAAQVEMGASWRVGVDPAEATELVTTGLFRWVRNPIFAAMLTVFLGVVLVLPTIMAAFALVASLAGIEIQVRLVEEPYLLRVHGERYRSYARRVGRFVPGFGRLGSTQ